MKNALRTAGIVALIAALGWIGLYASWHIRILGAIRTLETQTVSLEAPPSEAGSLLLDAGCRAMPYLVGSLDGSKNIFYLSWATQRITAQADTPGFEDASAVPPVGERTREWRITPEDSGATRQLKCDTIRGWWSREGSKYHQTWRVWSDACPRPR